MLYFYIPNEEAPADWTGASTGYAWAPDRLGKWNWTWQTCQHLVSLGIACEMTEDVRAEGIVFAHRSVLPDDYRPHDRQLLVCIAAERVRHPFAQFHLLQDPAQAACFERTWHALCDRIIIGRSSRYVRYWPQPGLIPRVASRGSRFENVVFKGMPNQLTPELTTAAFAQEMRTLGLQWRIETDKSKWPDYSNVDAVLAVRSFTLPQHSRKPATKLYNAWLAGVPAVLGPEPAFRHEGNPGHDFLEVHSVGGVVHALSNLKRDEEMRDAIVDAGMNNAHRYQVSTLAEQWRELIDEELVPLYRRWIAMRPMTRQMFFEVRSLAYWSRRVARRLNPFFNPYL